tara:strand:+ start:387 stop:575 length:189 start_codon:yes stop_codon:yes gene_type:complete
MSYKYLKSGVDSGNTLVTHQILRTTDNAIIPFDEDNSDYQEYLQWRADGNEPEAAEDSVKTN